MSEFTPPLRVLLVDDDKVLSGYHAALLQAIGLTVEQVARPSWALSVLDAVDPDLIIVDYHMPEMSGPELAVQIRQLPGGECYAILLITADGHSATLATAIRQGISTFMRKPLDPELFPVVCQSVAANARRVKNAIRQAEQASRSKSEFLAGMSHELRTPLNAILGLSQGLTEKATHSDETRQKAGEIERAGRHLLDLVDRVSDLATLESNAQELELEPVAIKSLLASSLAMAAPAARLHGIELLQKVGAGHTAIVHADRARLRQVLDTLLANALRHSPPAGTVRVIAERRDLKVRVCITDSGPSTAHDTQDRLFRAADRPGPDHGRRNENGINLMIAKRLMERMHGQLGVDSPPGQDSTFWIELPAASESDSATSTTSTTDTPPRPVADEVPRPLILSIEDNAINQRLIQMLFAKRTHLRLCAADDAETGIEMARQQQPDAILMDINLPGMNGFEALQALKADPATAHIPVIALSANTLAEERDTGSAAGFAAYLSKPLAVGPLFGAIESALAARLTANAQTPRLPVVT